MQFMFIDGEVRAQTMLRLRSCNAAVIAITTSMPYLELVPASGLHHQFGYSQNTFIQICAFYRLFQGAKPWKRQTAKENIINETAKLAAQWLCLKAFGTHEK